MELITGSRSTIQTKDNGWLCRSSRLDVGITLIEHRLHTPPRSTGENNITNLQGTIGNQYGRYISTSFVERRLDDSTCGTTVRVSLQVEHISLKEHLVKQIVNTDTLLGTDFLTLVLTTPLLNEQVHVSQVLTNTVWVGTWLINLVDGEYHWHTCSLSMGDSLLGSRHHRVVGCDDDDGDIGGLSTTGTHGGKRLVTWSIQEGYLATAFQCHTVSTDVLGNTTRLTGNHIGIADVVEQRSLTMVYVTHHSYDWSTWNQIVLIIHFLADSFLNLCADIFGLEAELLCHHIDGLCIQTLVDRYHDSNTHQSRDNLSNADIHHRSQFAYGNELCEFQYLTLLLLLTNLVLKFLLHSLALFLTVLSTLLVLALACKTGKGFLYLACYSLVVDLYLTLVIALVVIVLILVFILFLAATIIVIVLVAAIVIVVLAVIALRRLGIDVYTLLIDAHTLLTLAMLLGKLVLTLLTALLLGLLLRTSALIKGRKVYLSEHLRLIGGKLLLALQCEDRIGCSWLSCYRLTGSLFFLSFRLAFLHLRLTFLSFWLVDRLDFHLFRLIFRLNFWLLGNRLYIRLLSFFYYRSCLNRLFLLLRSIVYWRRTDGSSLCFLRLCLFRSSRLSSICLADLVQVNLAQRLKLLLAA